MTVPSVLRNPPWRRARSSTTTPATAWSIDAGPRLVWEEGEQATFAGARGARRAGDAEERLLERLLDAADAGRPLPTADMARLGDAMLAQLADETDARCFDALGLRLLLGRLGERALGKVLAALRARPPESGAFAAAGPIASPELAPIAARLLAMQRDGTTESDAERWLARHPSEALVGLASLSDDAARTARALVAARTGRCSSDALAPFAALSVLGDRAVALAAAFGHDGLVFDRVEAAAPISALVPWIAHALGGPARGRASAWLVLHAAVARPVLEQEPDRFADALAFIGGDALAGDAALRDVPERVPALPTFFDRAALPEVRLASGEALSRDETRVLGEMLRFSPLARPYAGVAQVKGACDATSLDRFATALLVAWIEAGAPPTDRWALESIGKIGGDLGANELATRTRAWAVGATPPRSGWDAGLGYVVLQSEGDRAWSYARSGIEVLGALASPASLTALDDLARRGSASWLRKEARRVLDEVAETRTTGEGSPMPSSRARFEDAIVPDLGLDADGSLLLSLGPRAVRVGFDEVLVPHVRDEAGARLASFPRARKTDDAGAYARARERWTALQDAAKALARQQLGALEDAMCAARTWRTREHAARFVAHPLLSHLGRRLVWACVDEAGRVLSTFRIAEDGSLADGDDNAFALLDDARIAIAHPIALTPEVRARWAALLSDYRILQPFAQLGRETFDSGALTGRELVHVRAKATSRGRLFGLGRRGREPRGERGVIARWERELALSGAIASIEVSPGLAQGDDAESQRIEAVDCSIAMERIPAIDRSELLRDLEWLTRP